MELWLRLNPLSVDVVKPARALDFSISFHVIMVSAADIRQPSYVEVYTKDEMIKTQGWERAAATQTAWMADTRKTGYLPVVCVSEN